MTIGYSLEIGVRKVTDAFFHDLQAVAFSFKLQNPLESRPPDDVTLACVDMCFPAPFAPKTALGAALGVMPVLPPNCIPPAFRPPACAHICRGIVSGGACLCPPGRFGESCDISADPNPALSMLVPGRLNMGEAASVQGPAGDGVAIPAGALNLDASLAIKAYQVVPQVGDGQVSNLQNSSPQVLLVTTSSALDRLDFAQLETRSFFSSPT